LIKVDLSFITAIHIIKIAGYTKSIMQNIQRVAIIGAGIAGISCARALKASGKLVTLFDKSTGPGGRASHRLFEQWGADHGAQYFTAREIFSRKRSILGSRQV
jgi:hypothetical protein